MSRSIKIDHDAPIDNSTDCYSELRRERLRLAVVGVVARGGPVDINQNYDCDTLAAVLQLKQKNVELFTKLSRAEEALTAQYEAILETVREVDDTIYHPVTGNVLERQYEIQHRILEAIANHDPRTENQ